MSPEENIADLFAIPVPVDVRFTHPDHVNVRLFPLIVGVRLNLAEALLRRRTLRLI